MIGIVNPHGIYSVRKIDNTVGRCPGVKGDRSGHILAGVRGFESLESNTWVTVITEKVYASYKKI